MIPLPRRETTSLIGVARSLSERHDMAELYSSGILNRYCEVFSPHSLGWFGASVFKAKARPEAF